MPVKLSERYPIFIGLKMDGTLRRMLQDLNGPDRRYISEEDPSFLMTCRLGNDEYIGKRIDERLTTDRIDDVRRNVLSILQRLCPEFRFPNQLVILACEAADTIEPGFR